MAFGRHDGALSDTARASLRLREGAETIRVESRPDGAYDAHVGERALAVEVKIATDATARVAVDGRAKGVVYRYRF